MGISVKSITLGSVLAGLCLAWWVPTNAAQPSGQAAAEVRTACTELVLDYAFYRDRLDANAVGELFTEDAVMTVLGQVLTSRKAIQARIETGAGSATRHLMSTIRIFQQSADRASGVSYVMVVGAPPGDLPMKADGFLAVGEYHDQFVRTEAGWKISQRTFVPVFEPK